MVKIQRAIESEDGFGAVRISEEMVNGLVDFRIERFFGMEGVEKTHKFYKGGYIFSAFSMVGKEKKTISFRLEYNDLDNLIDNLEGLKKSKEENDKRLLKKGDTT